MIETMHCRFIRNCWYCWHCNQILKQKFEPCTIKFVDDIILSIPIRPNAEDPSGSEVQNIKSWSRKDRMRLNLIKMWEIHVRGRTRKPYGRHTVGRNSKLKLLGVTFNEHSCNWDTHFDHNMLSNACSRLYILRVFKYCIYIFIYLLYLHSYSYFRFSII